MRKVIGLTGGIASGKSTVTNYLRKKGYQVIDADQLVHQLQEPGARLYQAILQIFGSEFLTTDNTIDRKKLGDFVFSDETAREKLAGTQNHIIREEIESILNRALAEEKESPIFLDIPLLFEQSYQKLCNQVWLVSLPESLQQQRLMRRSELTAEAAQARIASQMSLTEKIKLADLVLDNSKTISYLQQQIDRALANL